MGSECTVLLRAIVPFQIPGCCRILTSRLSPRSIGGRDRGQCSKVSSNTLQVCDSVTQDFLYVQEVKS